MSSNCQSFLYHLLFLLSTLRATKIITLSHSRCSQNNHHIPHPFQAFKYLSGNQIHSTISWLRTANFCLKNNFQNIVVAPSLNGSLPIAYYLNIGIPTQIGVKEKAIRKSVNYYIELLGFVYIVASLAQSNLLLCVWFLWQPKRCETTKLKDNETYSETTMDACWTHWSLLNDEISPFFFNVFVFGNCCANNLFTTYQNASKRKPKYNKIPF